LPELVDKLRDFGVEDEAFSGTAAVADTTDIDAVDGCG